MQIGFNVWQEALKGKETNELYYSFFSFFMFGSCFIVLKVNNISFNIFYNIYIEKKFNFLITKII